MSESLVPEMNDVQEMRQFFDRFSSFIPGIKNPQPVPVLQADKLTREVFMRDWVGRNRPCLIKGAVKHWPAVQKWRNKEYWLTTCENHDVSIFPHQNFIAQERQDMGHEVMPFHAAVERLHEGRDHIFSMPSEQVRQGSRFSSILKDMAGFNFLQVSKMPIFYYRTRFFMYRRAATNWHYHGVDETLMCQVNGTKRVALLSPHIPRPKYVTDFLLKERYLNEESIDSSLDLKPLIVDVEEGDSLYIPPYWHHLVVPVDGEIGFTVAYCWKSPDHVMGNFSNYFVRTAYRQGMSPFKWQSLLLPFFALYAGTSYSIKKLAGKA
jgi:hypothetical protein